MKLTNVRAVGRFRNQQTGQEVNIRRRRRVDRGTDISFYVRSGIRILVSEADLYGGWTQI